MDVIPYVNTTTNTTVPGKLDVLLGGVYLKCYNDTNCPGAAVCAINQAWQARKNVGNCMCPTVRGLGGTATCDSLCDTGNMIAAVLGVAMIFGIANTLVSTICLIRLFQYQKHRTFKNPVTFTLLFSSIGSFLIFIACCLQLAVSVGFAQSYEIQMAPGNREVKRVNKSYDYAFAILLGIGQPVGLVARLFLTMSFVDLASRSLKIQKNRIIAVYSIALAFTMVSFCILFPFYVYAAELSDQGDTLGSLVWIRNINITWSFIQAGLILLNLLAFIKAVEVIQFRRQVMRTPSEEPTVALREDKFIAFMKRMMVVAAAMIAFSIAQITGNQYTLLRFYRTFYSDPLCDQTTNPANLSNLAFMMALLLSEWTLTICIWFVYPTATTRIREAKSVKTVATSPQQYTSVQVGGDHESGASPAKSTKNLSMNTAKVES